MRWSKLIWYTVVQSLNHVWLFVDFMYCIMPVSPVLHSLLEFVQVHVHLTIHPLPPPSPFSLIFSSIRVFSSELALRIMWPKYQFSSVIQSCPTLCDPMDCSMPVFPVHHQLSEFAQTNVDLVGDVIDHLILCPLLLQPLIFPSIRVFSNESVLHIRWPKVLEIQLQHQSFQWTPRTDL